MTVNRPAPVPVCKSVMVRAGRAVSLSIFSSPSRAAWAPNNPGRARARAAAGSRRAIPGAAENAATAAGRTGRVLAADNGRPVARLRVHGRGAPGRTRDADGRQRRFDPTELMAGRYSLGLEVGVRRAPMASAGRCRPARSPARRRPADERIEFQLPRGASSAASSTKRRRDAGRDGARDAPPHSQRAPIDRPAMGRPTTKGCTRLGADARRRLCQRDRTRRWRWWAVRWPRRTGRVRRTRRRRYPAQAARRSGTDQLRADRPGVPSVAEAKPVNVGLSRKSSTSASTCSRCVSRISGIVSNPDGTPVTSGNVNLMSDTGGGRGNQIGMSFGGRIQWDGAFTIGSAPGRYILRARRRFGGAAVRGAADQRDRRRCVGRHRYSPPARRSAPSRPPGGRPRPTTRSSESPRRRPTNRSSDRSRMPASTGRAISGVSAGRT